MRACEHINLTGEYAWRTNKLWHPPGPLDDQFCQ